MRLKLCDIARIQFGLHSSNVVDSSIIRYIQVKNFDTNIVFDPALTNFIDLDERDWSHLLEDGDVLFVGKGSRNFAWTFRKEFGPSIASSIFFVFKLDKSRILPDYLTTILNSEKYQNIFQNLGAGSSIASIRKSELEVLLIDVPSIALQYKIADLNKKHLEYIALSNQLISEKKKLFKGIINKLINE